MVDSNAPLKAVGYCRTSGEGQRDNTSIPRQKYDIETLVQRNGWTFVRHYVDESRSGAKIEGRDQFQQMMRDAANGHFDIVVIYDISRFGRDGFDILSESNTLKKTFGIDVLDTKVYDTRDHRRTLSNFVSAGVAENERLTILERTVGGRIQRAKEGMPWSSNPPIGRAFQRTGKHSGQWIITDKGHKLAEMLGKYADGVPPKVLSEQYGCDAPTAISTAIKTGHLSGPYVAIFNSPEIGIHNLEVSVPGVPPLISPHLEKRVRDRAFHNRRWNKQNRKKYLLTGFARCGHCGRALRAQWNSGHIYYRHLTHGKSGQRCPFHSIRGDLLEPAALDFLYRFFLDEPTYNEAIRQALPSDDDRAALEKDISAVEKRLTQNAREINNLVKAIAAGADVSLLLDRQEHLKAEQHHLQTRRTELTETLAAMPDPAQVQHRSAILRILLMEEHRDPDWRKLPYDQVRRFLHFLFGDNPIPPGRNRHLTGHGIAVSWIQGRWHLTFSGVLDFHHDVVDGRPVSHALQIAAQAENTRLRRLVQQTVSGAKTAQDTNRQVHTAIVKPSGDNVPRYGCRGVCDG